MIDYTITMGNIIEITTIAGGGLILLIKQNGVIGNMKDAIKGIQAEVAKIGILMTNNAVLQQRVLNVEEDVRDLKRGKGYISKDIDGEYSRHGKIK